MMGLSDAGLSSLMASASLAFSSAAVQFWAFAADCASLIALTRASFLVLMSAAEAGTDIVRAADATPRAKAAEIARVVFQIIGFLFRSGVAISRQPRQTPPTTLTRPASIRRTVPYQRSRFWSPRGAAHRPAYGPPHHILPTGSGANALPVGVPGWPCLRDTCRVAHGSQPDF